MDQCPKCTFPLSDGVVECPACGVVIAKYLAQVARAPRPAATVPPPLPPASENLQQAPGLPGIGGLLLFFVLFQVAEMVYVVVGAKKALLPLILGGTKIAGFFPFLPVAVNFEGIFKLIQIAGGLLGIVLILSRAPRTPLYWRVLLMLTIIADVVGFWALSLIPEYREPSVNTAVLPALRSLLGEVQDGNLVDMTSALLCLVYWSISPRVKSTFVVPSNPLQARVYELIRWGMIFSILWPMGIGATIAVIYGIRAERLIRESGGALAGRKGARWCLILGYFGLILWVPILLAGISNLLIPR